MRSEPEFHRDQEQESFCQDLFNSKVARDTKDHLYLGRELLLNVNRIKFVSKVIFNGVKADFKQNRSLVTNSTAVLAIIGNHFFEIELSLNGSIMAACDDFSND